MGIFDKLFKNKLTNQQLPVEELAIYALELIDSGMECSTRSLQLKLAIGFNRAESLKKYLWDNYPDICRKQAENRCRQELELFKIKTTIEIEFPRHMQILKESAELIENTKNIYTLKSRYFDILEQYDWMAEQKQKGIPISFTEPEIGLIEYLNKAVNVNIIRIAKLQYKQYDNDILSVRTSRGVDSKTKAIFETLATSIECLKPSSNYEEALEVLKGIHYDIENVYSDMCMRFKK